MSNKRNTTTTSWAEALLHSLAYSPWLMLMIPPVGPFAGRRERSGA